MLFKSQQNNISLLCLLCPVQQGYLKGWLPISWWFNAVCLSLESRTFHLKEVVLFEKNERFLSIRTGATISGASACNTSEVLHPTPGHCWWARAERANPGVLELLQRASDMGLFLGSKCSKCVWEGHFPSVGPFDLSHFGLPLQAHCLHIAVTTGKQTHYTISQTDSPWYLMPHVVCLPRLHHVSMGSLKAVFFRVIILQLSSS